MKKPEILSPAGNIEKLKFAFAYGADAVYAAGKNYSLRNFSGNFDDAGLKEAVQYAHSINKKIYITVNVFPHNRDLEGIKNHLKFLNEIKPDGLIISDLGVFSMAKKEATAIPVHISVQSNNLNYMEVNEWHGLGAKRIVLARELSFEEIREIREKCPQMELEIFVHGAICMSYSGRCLLSDYMAGRSANSGECAQSCRWSYELTEEKRPGERFPVEEDSRGSYILNSKDLNTVNYLQEFIKIGIDSFKIEGRMKSAHYTAVTTAIYRAARDKFISNPKTYSPDPKLEEELDKISHREYTSGFYFAKEGEVQQSFKSSDYISKSVYMGHITGKGENGVYKAAAKNTLRIGDKLEAFTPDARVIGAEILSIKEPDGVEISHTKGEREYLLTISAKESLPVFAILRKDNI